MAGTRGEDLSLAGRTVVVTGAASGIGAAVAARAAAEGADVIGLDLRAEGGRIIRLDLASEDSIAAAAAELPDRIDALCNVAGVPGTAPPSAVLGVNLLGTRRLTEVLSPRLAGGAVVNVASTAGSQWSSVTAEIDALLATGSIAEGLAWLEKNPPAMPIYDFSKAALIVWTMRAAWHWHEGGPRVNSVSPGAVETPILGDFRASMGPVLDNVRNLVGRNARPEEIAPLVCFLASPAAGWVNGTDLVADGGFLGGALSGAADLSTLFDGM